MVTHDYKLIFVHIPKCGGRSISEKFNQRFDQFTANYYHDDYGYFWPSYNIFTIIRNPYARYVSMYHYIIQHRRHRFEPIAVGSREDQPGFAEWLITNISAFERPFKSTSAEAERGTDYMLGSPHWFSAQARFIANHDGYVFDEIKIFKLEDGMQRVDDYLQSIGIPGPGIPHHNKSIHEPWMTYYNDDLLKFINSFDELQIDCLLFNYEIIKTTKHQKV